MHVDELRGRRIAIWGYAREGQAALRFLRERGLDATILDDNAAASPDAPLISGRDAIAQWIRGFDVVVKSPGISLYDPLVTAARAAGVRFTSLLNLWFAAGPTCTTICVTGTKGKSTTTALIAHILRGTGRNAMAAGNIGVPVTELPHDLDAAVIEVSSYQAADFTGTCDIAVLTSLSQEHLDWHGSVAAYQRDKLNLLHHARCRLSAVPLTGMDCTVFTPRSDQQVHNDYLSRPHNRSNLAGAIAVAGLIGIPTAQALNAAASFAPLPHRQQEIGEANGVVYVDDSISTTPEAALAALDVYHDRAVTLILGGHDRGIDYTSLIDRLRRSPVHALILLDASGHRIHQHLAGSHFAASMRDAVSLARSLTPKGGVVLLSPAAPSYGTYRSFIERGEDFARCAGLR